MATSSDTFERKEKKYVISAAQCQAIKQGLNGRMRLDDYGVTQIDSLYLDTPYRDLIARSLEKPLYKEKLRIRSYGPFEAADVVYIEIKKKFKGIVYKRRVRMSARGAEAYCKGELTYEQACEAFPAKDRPETDLEPGKIQIAREIDAFLGRYDLHPSMLISCQREAWCPVVPGDEDCVDRITFDESLDATDFMQSTSGELQHIIDPGRVVMEIKCAGGYPVWLSELLSANGVYPRSFSKYGTAYTNAMAERTTRPATQPATAPAARRTRKPAHPHGLLERLGFGRTPFPALRRSPLAS